MSEPLERRLSRLRRRIRQVVWLSGLSWLIAVVFGAALVVGLVDWAVHLDDAGVRLLLGLLILASAGWIGWRRLVTPLRRAPGDVELALLVERRFPGFNDSLSSTVEFLERGIDPAVGSPELQRRVVRQTMQQAEGVDLSQVVETRGVRRLVAVAVAVCLAAALIVGLNQASAGIALSRLVFPFADVVWPRTTDLRLLDAEFRPLEYDPAAPLRIARGDVLTVYVENARGSLPDDLRMEYRFSEDEFSFETLRTLSRRDAAGRAREVGVASLVATRGPVWFRAVGGDDRDKPPFELEVVPPPLVEELQVTLTPPAYSGKPVEVLPQGVGHVEGLVGTEVEVSARVNKQLSLAALQMRGRPARAIALSQEGRRLNTSFTISEPGVYSYWFDLRDSQGFENPEAPRYEVRAVADSPPDIQIEEPAVDQYVTAVADVPLRFVARDDLGLKSVRLHYRLGSTQDDSAEPRVLRDGDSESERPRELVLEETWSLSELALSPGMRVVFYATATDHYDLGEEHVGRSISRTLTIVTGEEKQAELASRQAQLLEELERLVEAQSRAREQVGELQVQLDTVGSLRAQDVDLLKRIELDQRQISARLLNPVDGFETRTRGTIEELKQNKIDAPEMTNRLSRIADETAALRQSYLPVVEQELTRARKAANAGIGRNSEQESEGKAKPADENREKPEAERESLAPEDSTEEVALRRETSDGDETAALERARENQDAVLESLDAMRRLLAEWHNRRDLLNELEKLAAGQEQVQQDAAEIGLQTLGRRSLEQLAPQEEAELAKVAERQRRQADKLDEFRESLKAQAEEQPAPRGDNETLRDAQQYIDEAAIGGKMRQTADALKRNQVGMAAEGQQQIAGDLDAVRDILTERGAPGLEMLVKKLKQAEQDLLELRERQEELRKKTEQAEQLTDRAQREQTLEQLRKEQQAVRDKVARLSRRLRRLQARRPEESAARAADRLRRAEEQLGGDLAGEAAAEQQEALDDLEQAQRELAQARREAEERLARELMEKMADKLKLMIVLEQSVIDETQRLDAAFLKRGSWSRGQLSSLAQLRDTQVNLQRDTVELTEAMSVVEVFALALEGAAQQMKIAADRLGNRQTDALTVAAEEAARQRFVELVDALKPEAASSRPQPPGGAGGEQSPDGEVDVVTQLAQLKMLKTLQEGLLRRTAQIDAEAQQSGELSDAQRTQLAEIADLQGRLADLARNLMQAVAEAIEIDEPPGAAPDETSPEED